MPEQRTFLPFQESSDTLSTFRAYYSTKDILQKGKANKYIPESYLPEWTDYEQMAQLSLHNPKVFTIRIVENKEPEQYKIKFQFTGTDWIFWFLIISLALLSWLRLAFGKIIDITLAGSVSYQAANRMLRERNSLNLRISLALNLLFAFNSGIFAFQIGTYYALIPSEIGGYWITLIAFGCIAMIYLIKELILRLLGFIADISSPISEYLNIISINNKVLGMVILPVIIGIQYAKIDVIPQEWMIFTGLGIFFLFYLIRIIRGIIISLRYSVSIFYSFLYLCALEIAPMLFMYTIAISL